LGKVNNPVNNTYDVFGGMPQKSKDVHIQNQGFINFRIAKKFGKPTSARTCIFFDRL
jgi:hypothetical protein